MLNGTIFTFKIINRELPRPFCLRDDDAQRLSDDKATPVPRAEIDHWCKTDPALFGRVSVGEPADRQGRAWRNSTRWMIIAAGSALPTHHVFHLAASAG